MIVYTPPGIAERIPLIDLSGSFGAGAARAAVVEQIRGASRDVGFFYVVNHHVPAALLQAQLEQARRLFELPDARKLELDLNHSPCRRGYEAMALQVLDEGSPPDLKESFMLGRELAPEHPYVQRGVPQHGPNQWPSDLLGFRTQMESYVEAMLALGRHLVGLLAQSLEQPADHFDAGLAEAQCAVRLLRYPPQPADAAYNQIGAGAHTDWGTLTILLQDDCGGLEVQNLADQWLRATPIEGSLVVNLGQLTERLSNGYYRATPHRVMNNTSGRPRHSVATFFDFDYFYRVECLPGCVPPGEAPRYAAATVGEHVQELLRKTYGLAA